MSNDPHGSSEIFKGSFSTSNCPFYLRDSFKVSKCWSISFHYYYYQLYHHHIMWNYNWLVWRIVVKCQTKSETNKFYVTKCIASVYQIDYSLLFLNTVCVLGASLPSFLLYFLLLFFFCSVFHPFIVPLPFFFFYLFFASAVLSFKSRLLLLLPIPVLPISSTESAFFQRDLREQIINLRKDRGKGGWDRLFPP